MPERPSEPGHREQQLLRHARREGLLIIALWAACLIWSTVYGWLFGYRAEAADAPLILGMPAWIFWSVVLPWGLCLLFSVWFCFVYMADDDLGKDRDEG